MITDAGLAIFEAIMTPRIYHFCHFVEYFHTA